MQRPANYNTRHKNEILRLFAATKDTFVTAGQLIKHLRANQVDISKPTVYRQLDRLVAEGKLRRLSFDGISGFCYQYVDPGEAGQDGYHLKCESCNGVFDLSCDEVSHVSRHIFETHDFQVNDLKTVFYGKCKVCLHE